MNLPCSICSSLVVRHAVNTQTNNMQSMQSNEPIKFHRRSVTSSWQQQQTLESVEIVAEEAAANCGKSSKQ